MKKYIVISIVAAIGLTAYTLPQDTDLKASIKRGEDIYSTRCVTCHMSEGEGLPGVYPPIAKADNLKDKDRLIKVVLLGQRGPTTVNKVKYNGEMIPIPLNDQQTADVLNYIRNSWGNKAEIIHAREIKPALQTTSKNYQKY